METFTAICELWDNDRALATDMKESVHAVQKWRLRDKIPPHQWQDLVKAARKRGFDHVTLELLASIAKRRFEAA